MMADTIPLNGILATLGVLNPTVSAFYPDRV